jgi:hypothetical protein
VGIVHGTSARDILKSLCTTCINDTRDKFATGVNDSSGRFATGINDTGDKFCHQLLVLFIPVAKLPPVATIPEVALPPATMPRWQNATGVNDSGGKLPPVSTTPAAN